MLTSNLFQAIANLTVSAKARNDFAHADFLRFYRELVENLPTEATKLFGRVDAKVRTTETTATWMIELTATDFIWWKQHIEIQGVRFIDGPARVQLDMLNKLAKSAEAQSLSPDERKALLAMLDGATALRSDQAA